MGIRAPEFWITTDEMHELGLPETADYLRFEKGGDKAPFFCIHTDDTFLNMLSLDNIKWPEVIDGSETTSKLSIKLPGVYQLTKKELHPVDESLLEMPCLNGKEAFLNHLEKMKKQQLDLKGDEATFRKLLSREHLAATNSFTYKENLVFSVLNVVAESNLSFPSKWNFDNLPGPLKAFCSDDKNKILGVSCSMTYAGKAGTYSTYHVEEADFSSVNVLLPFSAGKGWVGIHPDDQCKLNAYISSKFRKHCPSPMLHKDLLIDLDLLDSLGIKWFYFIQRPGDIIVTNPASPHQVVNIGYNLAEATNFYGIRHLVAARRRIGCKCPSRVDRFDNDAWKRIATFLYNGEFKFLCATNGINIPSPEEVATQILNEFRAFDDRCYQNSSETSPSNPKLVLNIDDVIQHFTQNHLNSSDAHESLLPTVYCEIVSTSPLDLSHIHTSSSSLPAPAQILTSTEDNYSVPFLSADEPEEKGTPTTFSRSQTPRSNTPQPPNVDVIYPSSSLESQDIFEQPRPQGRKRRERDATLFEDPSQKAKRMNARADYLSQLNYERGQQQQEPETSLQIDQPSSSSPMPSPKRVNQKLDPRLVAAERIKRNTKTYKDYKESRDDAVDTYRKKKKQKSYKNYPASAWFKDYIQRATRKIETAESKIKEYAERSTKPRSCNWELKLESALSLKRNLERRRLLHNVLQTMYQYCSSELQERLDEGYLEQEIFRDFVYFHSEENKDLLRASLEAHKADFAYWNDVLENEESWNAEFGVNYNYRIPCVEFSKLKFELLDFL